MGFLGKKRLETCPERSRMDDIGHQLPCNHYPFLKSVVHNPITDYRLRVTDYRLRVTDY